MRGFEYKMKNRAYVFEYNSAPDGFSRLKQIFSRLKIELSLFL